MMLTKIWEERNINKMKVLQSIGITILVFILGVVILKLLPKGLAGGLNFIGLQLDSGDMATKYLMRFTVRFIGMIVILLIIIRLGLLSDCCFTINRKVVLLSLIFFIYIVANMELPQGNILTPSLVILIIIECFATGFFEEWLFRGLLLKSYARIWGTSQKSLFLCALISGVVFGLFHFLNLRTGVSLVMVLAQVAYTAMMGVAFAALAIRTDWNLVWCGILHSLYNMASGFAINDVSHSTTSTQIQSVDMGAVIVNILLFVPLLLYGLLLLTTRGKSECRQKMEG